MANTIAGQEADKLKKEGNDFFRAKDFEKAVEKYSAALDKDFTETVLLNRAEAYLQLEKWALAYVDANEALRQNPDNFKGLVRRAKARLNLSFEAGAVKDIEKAMKIEPGNTTVGELLEEAKKRAAQAEVERLKMCNEVGDNEDDDDADIAAGASTPGAKEEGGSAANKGNGAENKGENAAGKSTSKKNKKKSKGSNNAH